MPQPQPQVGGQGAGGFIVPPLPPGPMGPVPPVVPLGPYPVGFVPQGGPQPPVIPAIERSPSVQSPVIPEPPLGWGMPDPSRYGGHTGPVRPAEMPYEEYPRSGPSHGFAYHPQESDELAIPSPPSDVSHEPLPVPGPDTFTIPQSYAEHDSRSSTPTQESYMPPPSPGALHIPAGGVPAVVPVAPSVGTPRLAPQQTVFPPPGQIIQPSAEPIIVQTTPPMQGAIPVQPTIAIPQPGMPIQLGTPGQPGVGTIVINPPPVPVQGSMYGPSRAGSRTDIREPVVVVPSSQDRSPVQIPATIVQVSPSVHTHDEPIHTSPSIHAIPEPHEVRRSPPPGGWPPRDGGRRPRRHRGSRSYSPDDYDRYGYQYYPPSDRGYHSPGRGYRRPYDYYDGPEHRLRRGSRRGGRYGPESEGDEEHSPDPSRRHHGRRPSRRSDYSDTEGDPGNRSRAPPSQREGDTAGPPSHPASSHTTAQPTIIRLGGEPRSCRSLWFPMYFHIELIPQIAPSRLI